MPAVDSSVNGIVHCWMPSSSVHGRNAVAVPEDMELALLETARSAAGDFEAFVRLLGKAQTRTVLTETMTSEDGSSRSQAQVHEEMLNRVVARDAYLIEESFARGPAKWLTDWNFPGAAAPRVRRIADSLANQARRAERDKLISEMGWRPTREYVEETYDVRVEAAPAAPAPAAPPPAAAALASPEAVERLGLVERAMAAIDDEDWDGMAAPIVEPVLRRVRQDPEGVLADLAAVYPLMDAAALADVRRHERQPHPAVSPRPGQPGVPARRPVLGQLLPAERLGGMEYVVEDPPRGAARRFAPDPGWSYSPGRLGGGPPEAGPGGGDPPWIGLPDVAGSQKGPADFPVPRAWAPADRLHAAKPASPTRTRSQAMDRIHAALGWTGVRRPGDERNVIHAVRTPDGLEDVQIDHAFVDHVARHRGRGDFANYILPTLEAPHEVWNTWVRAKDGAIFLRPHFLAAFDDGKTAVAVVHPKEAWVAWTFFMEDRVNRRRRGELLYWSGG